MEYKCGKCGTQISDEQKERIWRELRDRKLGERNAEYGRQAQARRDRNRVHSGVNGRPCQCKSCN